MNPFDGKFDEHPLISFLALGIIGGLCIITIAILAEIIANKYGDK